MTTREYKTITAYRAERDDLQRCGYRFVDRFQEPNNSFSVALRHPNTQRCITLVVQPCWGLVLVKEHKRILKCISIS